MLPRQFYSLRQKINERIPHGPAVSTVYMLHEVYADGEAPADAACAVSLSRFTAWLDRLPADQVGTPEQLNEQGAVLLTFDDMFASAYRYALPELRRRKLSYTVFIAPGLLGRKNYITEDELRTLAADPLCTVGAHTMRHEMLRFQKASAVRGELSGSKAYLEAALSREILNFAYPYGSVYACSRANIEQVQACGFRRGFSTLSRSVTASDLREPWFLPRRNINDTNLQRKGF